MLVVDFPLKGCVNTATQKEEMYLEYMCGIYVVRVVIALECNCREYKLCVLSLIYRGVGVIL